MADQMDLAVVGCADPPAVRFGEVAADAEDAANLDTGVSPREPLNVVDHQLRFIGVMSLHSAGLAAHSSRVAGYAGVIAGSLHAQDSADLGRAAELHDLGKLGIPDAILDKPSALSTAEYRLMQQHTLIGGQALSGGSTGFQRMAEAAARSHHERWDGHGYPDGLAHEQIPLAAQIASLADTYDALMSHRVYRRIRFDLERVLGIIAAEREKQFSPDVVDAFFIGLPHILEEPEPAISPSCWLAPEEHPGAATERPDLS